MAHEITQRADGSFEMAYRAGTEAPWHAAETHPQQVPADATIEDWIVAAGMDWTVERATALYEAGGMLRGFQDRDVLYRSDNNIPLGVVSSEYQAVQPRECIEFFADLVQSIGLEINAAGTLFQGRRYWATAKIAEATLIDRRDNHRGYLLLTTSADGMRATEARFTDVRVVCNNTLRASEKDSDGQIRIPHSAAFDAARIKERLGVAPVTYAAFMDKLRKLADVRLSDDQAQTHLRKVLGKEEKEAGREGKVFATTMALFRDLTAIGSDLPGMDHTAYSLLNSFTETLDHHGRSLNDSRRLESALMGPRDAQKAALRNELFELVS